ncbi:MAG TPA: hypothetical protein VN926_01870 [Bradyrhizobium sp.]|nr:hypothetical protein [Bradyrhizobium sp.]
MNKKWIAAGLGLLGSIAVGALALSQTIGVPQVQAIGPTDLFQDIVGGAPQAGNVYAPAPLLGNYSATLSGNNPENWLIGGDATTNLFQRATSGSSVTTTLAYGGPDRWAYWSGTNTAMTVSQDTTAADLRPGYKAAFKMARTSGQTGVVQMCMMQVLESVNSYAFQSATGEVDFDAVTGANFSAASGNVVVYFISGTGVDGSAATAAFNLNAGGGGSSLWTGQVNTGVTVSLTGPSTGGRYTAVAPFPSGIAQVAIAICYTPVGTAGTNDYIAFGNIQLTRNNALGTVAGSAGAALNVNDTRAKTFSRRSQAQESLLQYRYAYVISEGAAATFRGFGHVTTAGAGDGNGKLQWLINFPVVMRGVPTMTYAAGFAGFTTTAETTATNCSALAADATLGTMAASPSMTVAQCSLTSSTIAVGLSMTIVDNGGTGKVTANAEL